MDEAIKQAFKGRFMILTVMLNIIILCFAMAVFVLFRFAPEGTLGLAIGILLLAVGVALSVSFRKHYTLAKAWLNERP